MTDIDVQMLMGLPVIAAMSPERFPEHTPLAGILMNDTRLLEFKAGEIVVREGDYGNSAFLILDGNLRVVLAPNLPRNMIGRKQTKKKNFFQAAAQLWTNSWIPEVRDQSRYADQGSPGHGTGAQTHVVLQDIPAVLDEHRTAQLTAGALFGELAALGRVPRTASVFAETDTKLLEIRWQGLREIRKYVNRPTLPRQCP
jgi:CRP-like cAMP-binding protein